MLRRLSIALLALALVGGGVASCPCIVKACAIAQAKPMDCCEKASGLSAPDCCPGGTQLSRQDAAPSAVAPSRGIVVLANQAAPLATIASARPDLPLAVRLPEPRGAPPGGTLIAQHTSLLL